MTVSIDLAKEGFRRADTHEEKVYEAARLFGQGRNPSNLHAQVLLQEAFTTDDFPKLLAAAFQRDAMTGHKDAVKEYEPFTFKTTVSDFRPKKLVDLFGQTYFDDVNEGEEYKGDTLDETDVEVQVGKTGRSYGLTWELQLSRDFSDLANFPKLLANGAVNTENRKIYSLMVGLTGLLPAFFGSVDTAVLNADNLQKAIEGLSVKLNHRDELVDVSTVVLVVPPALQFRAKQILEAQEIELQTDEGSGIISKVRQANPFRGLVQLQVSREFAILNGSANAGTSWAVLPGKSTSNPAVVHSSLVGHEGVDIRAKRDQGERVGGGQLGINEGSFNDDTIWFRGRHVLGASQGFTNVAYGSNGSAA